MIGGEIPPIKVGTVELRYPPAVQEDHDLMYSGLTQRLKGVGGALEKLTAEDIQGAGGTMNTTAVRLACHYTFSPRAGDYLVRAGRANSLAGEIRQRSEEDDLGLTNIVSEFLYAISSGMTKCNKPLSHTVVLFHKTNERVDTSPDSLVHAEASFFTKSPAQASCLLQRKGTHYGHVCTASLGYLVTAIPHFGKGAS